MRIGQATFIGLFLLTAGCNSPAEPGLSGPQVLPEDRGQEIGETAFGSMAGPAWGATSDDLYFQGVATAGADQRYRLEVFEIGDAATRVIHDAATTPFFTLVLAPDDGWAYVGITSGTTAPPSLRRVRLTDGHAELVTPRLSNALAEHFRATSTALASPDASRLAYAVYPDSLFVLTVATGESQFVTAECMGLAAFSPGSDAVICARPGPASLRYRIVNLATGSSSPLAAPNDAIFEGARRFRWDSEGIRIVFGSAADLGVADLDQQTVQIVALTSGGVLDAGRLAWSADGSTVAFWQWTCTSFGFKACDTQNILSVLDVASLTVRRAAVAKVPASSGGPTGLALSSDGKRVAYELQGAIYIKSVAASP